MAAGEVLSIMLVLVVIALPTMYGLFRALATQQIGWAIAILASAIVAMGWLVSLVFLLGPDRKRRAAAP